MRFVLLAVALGAFASLASSGPVNLQQTTHVGSFSNGGKPNIDLAILNFALTLEHLENEFYRVGLSRLGEENFRRANIPNPTQTLQNFIHISKHEQTHVNTLINVIQSLGGTPVPPCTYTFERDVTDVHSFIALARVLEKVGVSAYLGAASLITSPDILTAASTIATIEGRHASMINSASGVDPHPSDFDTPLDGAEILTLASEVIVQCPFDIPSTLGAAPFSRLIVDTSTIIRAGDSIQVSYSGSVPEGHFCGFLFSDQSVVVPLSGFKCQVPVDARGDIFVAILQREEKLAMHNAGSLIVAGPVVVAIDHSFEDSCKEFISPHLTILKPHPSLPHETEGRAEFKIGKLREEYDNSVVINKPEHFDSHENFLPHEQPSFEHDLFSPPPHEAIGQPGLFIHPGTLFEKPSHHGFERPSHQGFEKPSHQGFEKPSHQGFGKPSHQGFERPSHQGFERPSHQGFERPSHQGFEKPSHQGFERPSHQGFERPSHQGFDRPDLEFEKPSHLGFEKPSHSGFGKPSHFIPSPLPSHSGSSFPSHSGPSPSSHSASSPPPSHSASSPPPSHSASSPPPSHSGSQLTASSTVPPPSGSNLSTNASEDSIFKDESKLKAVLSSPLP